MNRREFFKEISDTAVQATSPRPRTPALTVGTTSGSQAGSVRGSPGSPRQYRRGTRVLISESRAWLCCDDLGFYAIDAQCPHLGSLVQCADNGYRCPGHGSGFDAAGKVVSGPAKHGLRYLVVDLDAGGNLVIRRDCLASPDDRLIA